MVQDKGKLVWMSYDNIGALEELKTKYGLKSPNRVLPILLDLEQGLNGSYELAKKQKCQSCGALFNIPENTSGVYKLKSIIRHSDLEKTDCRGTCRDVSGVKIKMKMLPGTIGIQTKPIEQVEHVDIQTEHIDSQVKKKKKHDGYTADEIKNMTGEEFDAYNTQEMLESGLVD